MFSTSSIPRLIALLCALLLIACGVIACEDNVDDSLPFQDEPPNLGQEIIECEFTDTEHAWDAEMTSGDTFDTWAAGFTGTYSNAEVDDEPAAFTLSKGAGAIVHRDSPQCGALYEIPLQLLIEQDGDSIDILLNGVLDEGPDSELIATTYYDNPEALEPFAIIPSLKDNQQLSDIQVALIIGENSDPTGQVHMRVETTEGIGSDGTVSLDNVLLSEFVFNARD